MTIKLTIENANEDLIKAIKSIVKVANAEIKITKEKIPAWLKEAKYMEKILINIKLIKMLTKCLRIF
jgi:hypothetical protein